MRRLAWLCAAVLVAAPLGVRAIERRPLPPFELVAADGTRSTSDQLARDGKWLLVYVSPGCEPCDTLMNVIDPAQQPEIPKRLVVVVGGVSPSAAAGFGARFKDLKGSQWFAEGTPPMRTALAIGAAPVVFGMRGQTIEWSLTGIVPNAAAVRSALVSWVAAPSEGKR